MTFAFRHIFRSSKPFNLLKRPYRLLPGACLGLGLGFYAFHHYKKKIVFLDSPTQGVPDPKSVLVSNEQGKLFVQPQTKCPPFPSTISLSDCQSSSTCYELLGVGVRTVSFLSFHVYAVGIYIAKNDIQLAHSILNFSTKDFSSGSLKDALFDPDLGTKVISHLLDHGVRFDIRIVPVRNTDFSHLRDGFVRGVLNHSHYKELINHPAISMSDPAHVKLIDEMGQGVNQLKIAFSRKMSVPKYNIIHLVHDSNASLKISYFAAQAEDPAKETILGTVEDPNVSKILILHYLTGKNPASESARSNAINGLTSL
ncbi:uncharacterized protein SAPINGB_P005677 [Magnusiomyces paraingens]|uniref:Altered inheritance of mitochondria protein 18, mitochondrial n=1 Tax=Magnusiomyces paraingens TaxID=2606893 RepID=A0A5E8C608_9ASCO|nr:uncharacterized protein SAPINGB_P005677 [Saprochaete ingens]VVT57401.1 unnamed protein product [Saprochaete ingens]